MSAGLKINPRVPALLLLTGLIASIAPAQDQIPNAGFENWSLGNPVGWITNNVPPLIPVTQSPVSHTGLSALQGEVVPFDRSNHSPEAFTGFHIFRLDAALTGWYQFSPQSGDVIEINLTMFANTARVGSGTLILSTAASSYTQFSMPIVYQPGTAAPDSCTIIMFITGSNLIGPVHVGSLMLLDDLALSLTSPLPVQISTLNATAVAPGTVRLQWSTVSEIDNYGFHVQKATLPSGPYLTLPNSFVPGSGTTIVPHSYSFIDAHATTGLWYYRLSQTDRDGNVHPTGPVSVNVGTVPTRFSLTQNYPNPFNPTTSIRYELPQPSFVSLKVYSIAGQEVATLVSQNVEAGIHTAQFDGSGLASGTYIYTLKAGDLEASNRLLLLR